MGTRADFYVGRGSDAEWLGSIGWDGYPAGIDEPVMLAETEADYRLAVATFLHREDGTTPGDGWPWPWNDSATTDYAYAYDGGTVYGSSFGGEWFEVDLAKTNGGEPEEGGAKATFPDMSAVKAVALGPRSGAIIIGGSL